MSSTEPELVTVREACKIIGGDKPIDPSTFYRGVKAGRYPKPKNVSPNIVRVSRAKLLACLAEMIDAA